MYYPYNNCRKNANTRKANQMPLHDNFKCDTIYTCNSTIYKIRSSQHITLRFFFSSFFFCLILVCLLFVCFYFFYLFMHFHKTFILFVFFVFFSFLFVVLSSILFVIFVCMLVFIALFDYNFQLSVIILIYKTSIRL